MGQRGKHAGTERRGSPTGIRFDPTLKQRLTDSAQEAGRSFSEEVAVRLTGSFEEVPAAPVFSDPETEALVTLIAYALDLVEQYTGDAWFRQPLAFKRSGEAIQALLSIWRPTGRATMPDHAPVLRLLRAQGLDALADTAKAELERANLGEVIGKTVLAWAEEAAQDGAEAKPELRRLIPIAATVTARLEANDTHGQARADLDAMVRNGLGAKP